MAGVFSSVAMAYPHNGWALGPGGTGFGTIGSETYNVSGVGPFSGSYNISGGVDAWATALNNGSPNFARHGVATSLSEGEVFLHIIKSSGPLQVLWAGGQYQTPAMGITSNNGAFNSVAPYGSPGKGRSPATFYTSLTYQPLPYWSVSAGRMASVEGTEFGIDFLNPSFFVSDLNNMQLAHGYGPQLNLFYGPATVNIEWSDSYITGRHNMLSASLVYNLNPSCSDYLLVFGHHNIGHTGNPGQAHVGVGLGFSEANSSLIGVGGQYLSGNWSLVPEAQFQWLPRSSVASGSANPKSLTTYYNIAMTMDITYQFNKAWSVNVQPQFIYQNNDKKDPNAALFGNWLQFDSSPAPGTFSPGTSMTGLQITPTWQHQNHFVRGTMAYTHISGYARGTGYGLTGNASNQVVGVLEVGYLLGKY